LLRSCENLHTKINDLENEKTICKTSVIILITPSWNLLRVKRIWTNYLDPNICFDKEDHGFNPNNNKRSYKHFFIKETSHKNPKVDLVPKTVPWSQLLKSHYLSKDHSDFSHRYRSHSDFGKGHMHYRKFYAKRPLT